MISQQQREQNAFIGEIFSSIQGEGLYVGVKQIFVRFMRCSLNCVYCDTPYSRMEDGFCSVETEAGTKKFTLVPNPLNISRLNKFIKALEKKSPGHHSISITGGEPLEQVDFLKEWLETVSDNFKIYLETNGTLPLALKKILQSIDIIAMDIKLPSSTRRSVNWKDVAEFLKLSTARQVFVKVVITSRTDKYEVLKAALMVKKISSRIPFVLQPATSYGSFLDIPEYSLLNNLQVECSKILKDIRIIPQVHKLLGIH
jgi:organic radical activating enzyme